jgi:hypothetical protein
MSAGRCCKVDTAAGKTNIGLALHDAWQSVFQFSFGENKRKGTNS